MGNRVRFNAREKEMLASGIRDIEVSYGSGQWIAFRLDGAGIVKSIEGYQRTSTGTVTSDTNTKGAHGLR